MEAKAGEQRGDRERQRHTRALTEDGLLAVSICIGGRGVMVGRRDAILMLVA